MKTLFILNELNPKISQTSKLKKIYSTLNSNSVRKIARLDLLHKPFLDKLTYLNLDKFTIKEIDAVNGHSFVGIANNDYNTPTTENKSKSILSIDEDTLSNGLCMGKQAIVDVFKDSVLKVINVVDSLILKNSNIEQGKEIDIDLLYNYGTFTYDYKLFSFNQLFPLTYSYAQLKDYSNASLRKGNLSERILGIVELSKESFEKYKDFFHYIQVRQLLYYVYSYSIEKHFSTLLTHLPTSKKTEIVTKIANKLENYFRTSNINVHVENEESVFCNNIKKLKQIIEEIKALNIPTITAAMEYLEDPNTFLEVVDISHENYINDGLKVETSLSFEKTIAFIKEFALKSNEVERPVILEIVKNSEDITKLEITETYQKSLEAYEFLNSVAA